MSEWVVDSSVFVSGWVQKDKFHGESMDFFVEARLKGWLIHIPRLVVLEICGALSRQVSPGLAKQAIGLIQALIRKKQLKLYSLIKFSVYFYSSIVNCPHNLFKSIQTFVSAM